MSQPPKSTIFAPSARWASLRMVFWVMGRALGERPELSQMESAAGSRLQAVALVGAPDARHRQLDPGASARSPPGDGRHPGSNAHPEAQPAASTCKAVPLIDSTRTRAP